MFLTQLMKVLPKEIFPMDTKVEKLNVCHCPNILLKLSSKIKIIDFLNVDVENTEKDVSEILILIFINLD